MKKNHFRYISALEGIDIESFERQSLINSYALGFIIIFCELFLKYRNMSIENAHIMGFCFILTCCLLYKLHIKIIFSLPFYMIYNIAIARISKQKHNIIVILIQTCRSKNDKEFVVNLSYVEKVKDELISKIENTYSYIQETNAFLKKENVDINKRVTFRTTFFKRKMKNTYNNVAELKEMLINTEKKIDEIAKKSLTKKTIYKKYAELSLSIKLLYESNVIDIGFDPEINDHNLYKEREFLYNIIDDKIDIDRESFKNQFRESWIDSNAIDKFLEISNDLNSVVPVNNIVDAIHTLTNEFKVKGIINRGWDIEDVKILFVYTFHFFAHKSPKIQFINESDYISFCKSINKIKKKLRS